jgi:hypothetical protein
MAPRTSYASALAGTQAGGTTFKPVLTRPSPAMLSKLLSLAQDDECDDDTFLVAIEEALPYKTKPGLVTLWVETGNALQSFSNDRVIASVFEDNQKAEWNSHLGNFVQINKAREGDLVITVTDETTAREVSGKGITMADGTQYKVASAMVGKSGKPGLSGSGSRLGDLFFIDIVGIRYNFDSHTLFKGLRRLKSSPLFQGYKSTIAGTACHSNIWRVYFCTPDIPTNLVVNNHAVDQIKLGGNFYGVFAKNFVRSTVPHQGNRSAHCLDLDVTTSQRPVQHEQPQKRPKQTATSPPRGSTVHPQPQLSKVGRPSTP